MENSVVEYFGGTISKDKETPPNELSIILNEKFIDNIIGEDEFPELAKAFSYYIINRPGGQFNLRRIFKQR